MQGYIKDHRKEMHSAIWMMPPLYHRAWQYLKYIVNHHDATIPMRDGTHLTIKAGQHLTSVRDIAKNIGWYEGVKWKEPNPKTVSTILEWMEKQSMIKIDRGKGNRQYTLITLLNWHVYQQKSVEGNSKVTVKEQCADINKNDKECFKNEKDTTTTTAAEVIENPVVFFEKSLCRLSTFQADSLWKWVDDFGGNQDIVNEAIQIADSKNKRYFGFVEYLLKEWKNNNLATLDRVKAYEQEKFNKQKLGRSSSYKKPIRQEIVPDWMNEKEPQPEQQQEPTEDLEEKKRRVQEKLNHFRE
ncbi:DnaD domain-containing protein [Bacillus sp. FJAT-18017]|uniref:DnaD domain-containing protein n=1 Tax=Bacillus sp. FJAT-18017 TaxID=1705566 RepID=UPI0006AE2C66|nr:DnaD domain protein [Bacillus sp. FJAT-18017]